MELIPGLPNDLAFECLIRISFDQFPKASSVCRAWKAVIKQPEFLRRRKASGLTRPVIAICQSRFSLSRLDTVGFRLTLFDPVKRRWHDFPPIPEVVERMPVLCSVVGIGAELAVIGGCDPVTRRYLNSVFIYNFFSATWRRGADMPGEDRLFFGCAASEDGGTVVVAGGRSSTTTLALKSTLAYDVARDTWTTLSDMSIGRYVCTCVFQCGEFHVDSCYTTETLDFVTRQWHVSDRDIWLQANDVEIDRVIYKIRKRCDVVALEDDTWVFVTRVPDSTSDVTYVTGWQGNMMVINTKGGEIHSAYVLELKSKKWTKVKIPRKYRGYVHFGYYCHIHI